MDRHGFREHRLSNEFERSKTTQVKLIPEYKSMDAYDKEKDKITKSSHSMSKSIQRVDEVDED